MLFNNFPLSFAGIISFISLDNSFFPRKLEVFSCALKWMLGMRIITAVAQDVKEFYTEIFFFK